jgi:hypothetical protein
MIELLDAHGVSVATNDDWKQAPNTQEIIDTGVAPSNDLESALLRSVPPGAYSVQVRGANSGTGIGLIEVYDLDRTTDSKLANISTRGFVGTGDNALIGGTIVVGQKAQKVIVRALGPSLSIADKLTNPTLELHDGHGTILAQNDNWRSSQEAEITATQIPPPNDLEAALVHTLQPGAYTAVVRGAGGGTGIGLVEVYALAD